MSFNPEDRRTDRDSIQQAKKRAAYFLGLRAYSKGELYKKLGTDFPSETCEAALEWAESLGYLNDREYAEKLAKKLIHVKRVGIRKASWEMRQKLVPDEIINDVLSEYSDDDMCSEITELLKRKYSDKLNDRKDIERVMNALARRGYNFDDIKKCISAFKADIKHEFEYD